ncbi:HAAS signaling domain-containing protein, partial [Micromonospora tulbaghiae]
MTVTGQEITDYVDRVRAALADLPPGVRDELTEELPEHLAEVAAEGEGTLVDRLGTPEAYAAELRAAAG